MQNLYYTAPNKIHFEEVKAAAIQIWNEFDDTYGYASEKINRIEHLPNNESNFMYMISMFDPMRQKQLSGMLSDETNKEIRDRMIAGGSTLEHISF